MEISCVEAQASAKARDTMQHGEGMRHCNLAVSGGQALGTTSLRKLIFLHTSDEQE